MKLEEQIKRMKRLMENEYQPDADDYFQDMYMSLKYMKLPADVRLHITQRGIPAKRNIRQKSAEQKPSGLWYGVGLAWPKFVEEEELGIYESDQFYVYEFDISKCNILKLTTFEEIMEFDKLYSVTLRPGAKVIDWFEVSKKYDGIEFNPYVQEARMKFNWYYSLDIASGCVWNTDKLDYNLIYPR